MNEKRPTRPVVRPIVRKEAAEQAAEQAAAEPEEETVRGEPLPGESLRTPGDTEYIYLYDEPTCRICMRSWQNCECFR